MVKITSSSGCKRGDEVIGRVFSEGSFVDLDLGFVLQSEYFLLLMEWAVYHLHLDFNKAYALRRGFGPFLLPGTQVGFD